MDAFTSPDAQDMRDQIMAVEMLAELNETSLSYEFDAETRIEITELH